ncbi:MAG: type II toxin-antitoxin system RelE/ParE family toxin [Epsilonproteobacteria bacterium]|nr:type II toxin-antitoxin system RelE/ParE family toxin [Campylobacterota bacterium]
MFSVETTPRFDEELLAVLDFIAIDNPNRALQFYDDLIEKLNNIPNNPFIYRKREGADTNTRELIFKGYTIPIYIHQEKKKVFILGIFNQNLWE